MKRLFKIALMFCVLYPSSLLAQETRQIYELKHRKVSEILELLGTRHEEGSISYSQTFNTIQVNGSPDLHRLVENILSRYDKPLPQFELRFYLLRASRRPEGSSPPPVNPEIGALLEEVSELTRYEHFQLIDSPILRLTAGHEARVSGGGTISYNILVGKNHAFENEEGSELRVEEFMAGFALRIPAGPGSEARSESARIQTSFSIADGEILILGTSQIAEDNSDEPFAIVAIVQSKKL